MFPPILVFHICILSSGPRGVFYNLETRARAWRQSGAGQVHSVQESLTLEGASPRLQPPAAVAHPWRGHLLLITPPPPPPGQAGGPASRTPQGALACVDFLTISPSLNVNFSVSC